MADKTSASFTLIDEPIAEGGKSRARIRLSMDDGSRTEDVTIVVDSEDVGAIVSACCDCAATWADSIVSGNITTRKVETGLVGEKLSVAGAVSAGYISATRGAWFGSKA